MAERGLTLPLGIIPLGTGNVIILINILKMIGINEFKIGFSKNAWMGTWI